VEAPPIVRPRILPRPVHLVGLVVLLLLNLTLKGYCDNWAHTSYGILPPDYRERPWRLLLPYDLSEGKFAAGYPGTVHWFTTGLVTVNLLEEQLGPQRTYLLLNAVLIINTFVTSWWALRSPIFTFTVTICLGFGTQLIHGYYMPSIVAFYLFLSYMGWSLLALYRLYTHTDRPRSWFAVYFVSLIFLALCHEQWLDYLVFLMVSSMFLALFFHRCGDSIRRNRTGLVMGAALVVGLSYLAIRMSFGSQQYTPGNESEMVMTYPYPILSGEDFVSNVFTYLYIAFTNYLPPWAITSMSDYYLGQETVTSEQHGFEARLSPLVTMHHQFLWYFYAGCVTTIFLAALYRNGYQALLKHKEKAALVTVLLLMVAFGFTIHALVKYRTYLSVPLLSYRCTTSVMGVTLLLGFGLVVAGEKLRPWKHVLLVAATWGLIFYGSLSRPHYLNHLSRQVGLGQYADPMATLRGETKSKWRLK